MMNTVVPRVPRKGNLNFLFCSKYTLYYCQQLYIVLERIVYCRKTNNNKERLRNGNTQIF